MDETGRELLGLLDGLPLALAQAASYLRETLVDYEQRSIGTTWTISFRAIEARNEKAANLLRLWAFIDNKDLWHGLLQMAAEGGEHWPGWLREMASSEVAFLDAA